MFGLRDAEYLKLAGQSRVQSIIATCLQGTLFPPGSFYFMHIIAS